MKQMEIVVIFEPNKADDGNTYYHQLYVDDTDTAKAVCAHAEAHGLQAFVSATGGTGYNELAAALAYVNRMAAKPAMAAE